MHDKIILFDVELLVPKKKPRYGRVTQNKVLNNYGHMLHVQFCKIFELIT